MFDFIRGSLTYTYFVLPMFNMKNSIFDPDYRCDATRFQRKKNRAGSTQQSIFNILFRRQQLHKTVYLGQVFLNFHLIFIVWFFLTCYFCKLLFKFKSSVFCLPSNWSILFSEIWNCFLNKIFTYRTGFWTDTHVVKDLL